VMSRWKTGSVDARRCPLTTSSVFSASHSTLLVASNTFTLTRSARSRTQPN